MKFVERRCGSVFKEDRSPETHNASGASAISHEDLTDIAMDNHVSK
ncbi:hypothetical protein ACNF42_08025 [Cuniculiplasma sp. SKW3]